MRRAAILLSRQALHPVGTANWIIAANRAMLWAKEHDYRVITAVHAPNWELLLTLAVINEMPITLAIALTEEKAVFDSFDLHRRSVEVIPVHVANAMAKEEICLQIDSQILQLSDILLPVSIRKEGNWSKAIGKFGKSINDSFRVPYQTRTERLKTAYDSRQYNSEIEIAAADFLFHWTRAASHPWPTERSIDFYRAIIDSSAYPRSAFHTLGNILNTGQLVASSRHIPKGCAVVSFSALSPEQVVPLMRWRQRYREMSFEPYGIGIRKQAALDAGIRPVIYQNKRNANNDERWLFQSIGRKTDWRQEAEYRYTSTLSLDQFSKDDLLIVTQTADEAKTLARTYSCTAIPLFA
jgi:hypothetical protein